MKTTLNTITIEKEKGRFYSPDYIVKNILDLSGYSGCLILDKHIIDNSCGDGAFLKEAVSRYCFAARNKGYTIEETRNGLSTYIHGIEIDRIEQQKCLLNIDRIAESFGITNVNWDVVCGDSLTTKKYDGKMDFVVGNPPYVRVHNLGDLFEDIKSFSFARNGMTDLFIVFYEIGLNMLNETGVLGYITPSSYFNSIAGSYMRKYLEDKNLLTAVVNMKHYQAFAATTYTAITILKKGNKSSNTEYYGYDEGKKVPYFIESLSKQDYIVKGNFYFASKKELDLLHRIITNKKKCDVEVKNGYATLCDKVFINNFPFSSQYIIPVIKSSKGTKSEIFFPYDNNGQLIAEDVLSNDKKMYRYLLDNKEKLSKRSNEKDADEYWYAFGRSQAIKDTFKDKLAINSLLRSKDDFKFTKAPAGTGVYGGLYIVSEEIPFNRIIDALKSDEFISYIKLLNKYKSGGYYTFSSKDVKTYLDYKLG